MHCLVLIFGGRRTRILNHAGFGLGSLKWTGALNSTGTRGAIRCGTGTFQCVVCGTTERRVIDGLALTGFSPSVLNRSCCGICALSQTGLGTGSLNTFRRGVGALYCASISTCLCSRAGGNPSLRCRLVTKRFLWFQPFRIFPFSRSLFPSLMFLNTEPVLDLADKNPEQGRLFVGQKSARDLVKSIQEHGDHETVEAESRHE